MTVQDIRARELQESFEQIIYQFQTVATESIKDSEDLNPKELNTIVFIGKKGKCIMREISAFLQVADSTVTILIDKLVKKNLVRRELSDEDRRVINILLTDKGKDIYKEHLQAYQKLCKGMLMTLNDQEQDIYVDLMAKIAGGAKEQFAKN